MEQESGSAPDLLVWEKQKPGPDGALVFVMHIGKSLCLGKGKSLELDVTTAMEPDLPRRGQREIDQAS